MNFKLPQELAYSTFEYANPEKLLELKIIPEYRGQALKTLHNLPYSDIVESFENFENNGKWEKIIDLFSSLDFDQRKRILKQELIIIYQAIVALTKEGEIWPIKWLLSFPEIRNKFIDGTKIVRHVLYSRNEPAFYLLWENLSSKEKDDKYKNIIWSLYIEEKNAKRDQDYFERGIDVLDRAYGGMSNLYHRFSKDSEYFQYLKNSYPEKLKEVAYVKGIFESLGYQMDDDTIRRIHDQEEADMRTGI